MDRIDQVRGDKGARRLEYDLEVLQPSGGRVTCECGASVEGGNMVRS
jgi:hypothetical protein